MESGLRDKVVVISGGGAGIGLAMASAFAREGARVVAGDLRPDALASVPGGYPVTPVAVDLSESGGPARLVDAAIGTHGWVDILVNNVGIAPYRRSFLDVTDDNWQALLDINLFSMVRAARAAIPSMISRGGGVVISISSDAGRQPEPFFVDYALSKA